MTDRGGQRQRCLFAVLSVACCILSAVLPVLAQTVRVTGTSVSMAPPTGFSPAERFPGFERSDMQASIMVTEVPGSAEQIKRGMTDTSLANQGVTVLASTTYDVGGKEALLLQLSQRAAGVEFLKWMLIAGDRRLTILIVGTFPRAAESELSDAIKASLLTARWSGPGAAPDHFEGLLFRVTPTTKLKIAGRMGNMVMLNESGNIKARGPEAALFIVGNSVAAVRIDDLRAFSEARAKQTAYTTNLRIVEGRPLTIDGSDAYELLGEANDSETGRPVTLYQIILPDGGGYFVMQGLIATGRADVLIPEFKKIVATFRRTGAR